MWDATCPDTYAPSYISHATREAGAVAERAEHLMISKYAHLDSSHHFVPVAVETSGVFGPEALPFIQDLSQGLRQVSQGHWNTSSSESLSLGSRDMRPRFLGQWEGQPDWKPLWLNVHCVCLFHLGS